MNVSIQVQIKQMELKKILTYIQISIQSCPSGSRLYNRLRCIHRPSQPSAIRISISATKSSLSFYVATQVRTVRTANSFRNYWDLRIKIVTNQVTFSTL